MKEAISTILILLGALIMLFGLMIESRNAMGDDCVKFGQFIYKDVKYSCEEVK